MWRDKGRRAEICCLVGVHLLMAPITFIWNYGNLAAYMESYFHYKCAPQCVDGDFTWIINLYLAVFGPGLFLFGFMKKFIGLYWTGIIAMVLQNAAFYLCAWTIDHSVVSLCVLMGVVIGLAGGVTMNVAFMYINLWAPKNGAIYIATATAWPPLLSMVQNQLITLYVNPLNLKPDAREGPKVYFSQLQILSRVPGAILILASMSTALQIVGFLMVSTPPDSAPDVSVGREDGHVQKECNGHNDNHLQNGDTDLGMDDKVICDEPVHGIYANGKDYKDYGSNNCSSPDTSTPTALGRDTEYNHLAETQKPCEEVTNAKPANGQTTTTTTTTSFTPSDALKTTSFWTLWLFSATLGCGLSLNDSFYKIFGLIYIHNDEHLTLLGTLIPLVVCASRLVFGGCIKRGVIKIKDGLVLSLMLNCWTCAFWFFAPQVHEALYMILILLMAFAHSFLHVIIGAGTLHTFGNAHFTTLYSMVYSGASVMAVVTALYVSPVLHAAGWFWVFNLNAIFSLIALAFAVFTRNSLAEKHV